MSHATQILHTETLLRKWNSLNPMNLH